MTYRLRIVFCFVVLLPLSWLFPAANTLFGQCKPSTYAFDDGERISYSVMYNWGPLWINAGKVSFETSLVHFKGKPCWHIVSTGRTVSSVELLFKVRDTYKSWIDTSTYNSVEFQRDIYENGYTLQNISWFNYRTRTVLSNTKRNEDPIISDTISMVGCTYDMLSACYYIRSLDMDTLIPGKPFAVNMAIDDKVYSVFVKFLGKETIDIEDGHKYACLKFAATMVEGVVFEKGQEAYVWITDDLNHIPVYLEAKILVGSVKVFLKDYRKLKYPFKVK